MRLILLVRSDVKWFSHPRFNLDLNNPSFLFCYHNKVKRRWAHSSSPTMNSVANQPSWPEKGPVSSFGSEGSSERDLTLCAFVLYLWSRRSLTASAPCRYCRTCSRWKIWFQVSLVSQSSAQISQLALSRWLSIRPPLQAKINIFPFLTKAWFPGVYFVVSISSFMAVFLWWASPSSHPDNLLSPSLLYIFPQTF